jgi:hypothetical protein
MTVVDEVALLRQKGYEAITIAGYDDQGYLPHWHRTSDAIDVIESDTLSRAASYASALVHEIDNLP